MRNSIREQMRAVVWLGIALMSATSWGASNYVSRPAGFVRYDVGASNRVLASMQFDAFNTGISSQFAGQLIGGSNTNNSDLLLKYDSAKQLYVTFWRTNNGTWYQAPQTVKTTNTLKAGEGIWIQNRHGAQHVFLFGPVALANTQTVTLANGLNLIGYPYNSTIDLNSSDFVNDGAYGTTNMSLADQVIEGISSNRYWLFKKTGDANNNKWLTSSGAVAAVNLSLGSGYWYQRSPTNAFNWTEARPFVNVFGVGTNAPQITALAIATNKNAITLTIACKGTTGENLEVFYKNMATNSVFTPTNGWLVAASGLATTGRTTYTWTDAGATNRSAITSVYQRVYLVGRQDIDSDADTLSDAREIFVYQTSPTNSDTDGDGLSDANEVNLYGTNPLLADTDGDGMSDADELRWGRDPKVNDGYGLLPWLRLFETNEGYTVGNLNTQDGWSVLYGSARIQTSVIAGGVQAVQIGGTASTGVSRISHFYGANTSTVVWTDMKVRLLPGVLPDVASNSANLTAVFAVTRDRCLAGYNGLYGMWVIATNRLAVDPADWLRLTVKNDYPARSWNLYRDGVLVLQNLGFADSSMARFSRVAVEGSETVPSYLDELSISQSMPAVIDSDGDGLSDAVEDTDHDGIVDAGETDPLNADTDGDGMDDGQEVAWGFDPRTTNSFARLPWFAGFESPEGYAVGALNGQQGWVATTSATVQATDRFAGINAMRLSSLPNTDSYAQRYFGAQGRSVVWMELYTKLPVGTLPDAASLAGSNSVLVAVNSSGILCGYNSLLRTWVPASTNGSVNPQVWTRLTFRLDYATRTWSAYVGTQRVFSGMPFADTGVRALSRLKVNMPPDPGVPSDFYADSVSVFTNEPADLDNDGDGIPNVWEIEYGLNPEESLDRLGDNDDDSLLNYEEFLAATDPTRNDTDGDGVGDYEEVKLALSDPLAVDFNGSRTEVCRIAGAEATTNRLGDWELAGSSIFSLGRNGSLEYLIVAPSNGFYVLEVQGTQHNPLTSKSEFALKLDVDEVPCGRQVLAASYGTVGAVRFFLQKLTAGSHIIQLTWNNVTANNTSLEISSLILEDLGGPDSNTNGVPDWLDHRLSTMLSVGSLSGSSIISPACVEGQSLFADQMVIEASYVPLGQTSQVVGVLHSIDMGWYANVLLSPTNSTLVRISDPSSGVTLSNTITWTEFNVLAAPTNVIAIRKDDALLLTAKPLDATDGVVGIVIVGCTNYTTTIDQPVPCRFNIAGTYVVSGIYSNGAATNAQITVKVLEAAFNGSPACVVGQPRDWNCPDIPDEAVVENDWRLAMFESPRSGGGRVFNLTAFFDDPSYVVARLGASGPVMASTKVDGLDFDTSAYGTVSTIVEFPDGSTLIEVRIAFSRIPEDLHVDLHVFVGGVTFEDGTIDKVLTASDFNAMGECRYRLLRGANLRSSVCHTTVFSQKGEYVGTP